MTRALRGAWQRRAVLLALLLLGLVVVTGTVGILGFTRAAGTSPTLVVPLVVLGLVAVPALGRELAESRRAEVGLARLRGAEVPQVVGVLATEPLVALLLGAAGGLPLGLLVAGAASRAWLDRAAAPAPDLATVLVCLTVVVLGLAGVLVGTAAVVREPLAVQVDRARRPRPAGTTSLFATVLVVVAAVVATYRTRVAADDPDLVTLAAPALVGLAAGELAVLGLRLVARAAVPVTTGRGPAPFLAVRRLARSADSAAAARLLVAVGVIAGLALTGAVAVDDWAEETARLRAGAPVVIPYDGSAAAALRTTRDADPDGRWLAAAAVVARDDGAERRAFVDAGRLARVAGDHLTGTGASGVGALADGLPTSRRVTVVEGDRVEADVVVRGTVTGGPPTGGSVLVEVGYVADGDFAATSVLRLDVTAAGVVRARGGALPDCGRGCAVTGLTLAPASGAPVPRLALRGLRVGGDDLLRGSWSAGAAGGASAAGAAVPAERAVVTWPGGLGTTPALVEPVALVPSGATSTLPVLTTGLPAGAVDVVSGPGGDDRPADVRGSLAALPLVEGVGVLGDLPSALVASPPSVAGAEALVLARADTPAEVLAAVRASGGGPVRSLADVRADVRDATGAAQARGYALVALFAALVAVLAVAAPARRRRGAHRTEVAALRLVGLPRRALRRAGRLEVAGQVATVVLAGLAGTLLAVALLLPHLPLLRVPATAIDFAPGTSWPALLAAVLGVGAVGALVGAGARRVSDRRTDPAVLREEVSS